MNKNLTNNESTTAGYGIYQITQGKSVAYVVATSQLNALDQIVAYLAKKGRSPEHTHRWYSFGTVITDLGDAPFQAPFCVCGER